MNSSSVWTGSSPNDGHRADLLLHVCGETFRLEELDATSDTIDKTYTWSTVTGWPDALYWSDATKVELALSTVRTVDADASLSGLALADDDGGAVALNPPFDPGEAAYAASVVNAVGRVTVTPATSNPFAAVEYLDGAGFALADADTVADGHQVDLEVGANVIGLRVTSSDGAAAQTYAVTVKRTISMQASCEPDSVWCANLTVGLSPEPSDPGYSRGYCTSVHAHISPPICDYGGLDDGDFALDATTHYAVGAVRWTRRDDLELHLQLDADFRTADLPFLTFRAGPYSFAPADRSEVIRITPTSNTTTTGRYPRGFRHSAQMSRSPSNYRWSGPPPTRR